MSTAEAPKTVHSIKDNKIAKFSKNSEKNSVPKLVFYEEKHLKSVAILPCPHKKI